MSRTQAGPADLFPPRFYARWLLALLAAVGVAISLVLTGMSLPSPAGEPGLASRLCTPGARINCDHVLASPWGKFKGMPTAMLGAGYFAAVFIWLAVVGLPNRAGRAWHAVPMALTGLGVVASAYFTFIMAVRLPVWCTWCLAAHAVNILLFAGILWTWPRRRAAAGDSPPVAEPRQPSDARALAVLIGCAGLLLCVLLGGIGWVNQIKAVQFQRLWLDATNNADYILWRHQSSPVRDIAVRPDDIALGTPDAPRVLVVFSDFECAGCREFHRNADSIEWQFHGTLRIVFKHFPMDSACNPAVEGRFHAHACDAATAAAAAALAGTPQQVIKYAKLLFDSAAGLPADPYVRLAEMAGIDGDTFASAHNGPEPARRVREDIELGRAIGVSATPAMFLDGRELSAWQILTNELNMRMDPISSLELWERLLSTPARNKPSSES